MMSLVAGAGCFSHAVQSNADQGVYGWRYRPAPGATHVMVDSSIELDVTKLYSGNYAKDLVACATVKNVGSTPVVFDSGEVSLLNGDDGTTVFSVMKDKTTVTLPENLANVLQRPSLDPGQKIKGLIYFPTDLKGGAAKGFTLAYKGHKLELGPRHAPSADQLTDSKQATVSECDR